MVHPAMMLLPLAAAAIGQNPAPADLNYARPPERSEAGLPIGNGRMGSLVWTDDRSLHLQINRVDVFNVNGASTSFPERNTEGCGGCAQVEIDLGKDAFAADSTSERLDCASGLATIKGAQVEVRALAWMNADVIAVEITDRRQASASVHARLLGLRPTEVRTRRHTSQIYTGELPNAPPRQLPPSARDAVGARLASPLDPSPPPAGTPPAGSPLDQRLGGGARGDRYLRQEFAEGTYYCGSAVVLRTVAVAPGTTLVLIATAASFLPAADIVQAAERRLSAPGAADFAAMLESNQTWWKGFWDKSQIHLHSADGVADRLEAGYAYFLYLMAATSRGTYPVKFNGMLWTTHGDERRWGGAYWGANQSCYYNNALFAADHPELMAPMFSMYTQMVPAEERAARQEWNSAGIYFPETVSFDGLAPMPAAIAAEMPGLYLMQTPWAQRSAAFRTYAGTMQPFLSRWNFINGGKWDGDRWVYTERGSGPYGPTSHILSRGAKIAYQYWQRYQYTQDRTWLRDRAYPILEGVAEFYRHFPTLHRSSDGLWHIGFVNSNEGLWGGRDTDEEIASMRAIFATAARASNLLGVNADRRAEWLDLSQHLAPLPRSDLAGVFMPVDAPRPVWQRGFEPVVQGRFSSLPDGNTMPEWFFDEASVESPAADRATAEATFDFMRHRPARRAPVDARPPRARRGGGPGVLSKLPLAAAQLGRAGDFRDLIVGQMLGGETAPLENRMDLREGAQTMGVERLGNGADALHSALCLDSPPSPGGDPVIRPFAAWPKEWDADFRLVCQGNFVVSGSQKGGKFGAVRIESRSGSYLHLRLPWAESIDRPTKPGEVVEAAPPPLQR